MAMILIVEDDGLVAGQMARTMRQAGHTPVLARDARSALEEALARPDAILLDLGLPDLPGEELLRLLKGRPETARIPVLVITGKEEAAARLRGLPRDSVDDILLKPISGAQLREVVDAALAKQRHRGPDALRLARERQREAILRLVVEGSDSLAFHVSRRLCADRMKTGVSRSADALTWEEIAEWGRREGLLDAEQAKLLRRVPLADPRKPREGRA
jgi:DNA-binding response OmpR family regulator